MILKEKILKKKTLADALGKISYVPLYSFQFITEIEYPEPDTLTDFNVGEYHVDVHINNTTRMIAFVVKYRTRREGVIFMPYYKFLEPIHYVAPFSLLPQSLEEENIRDVESTDYTLWNLLFGLFSCGMLTNATLGYLQARYKFQGIKNAGHFSERWVKDFLLGGDMFEELNKTRIRTGEYRFAIKRALTITEMYRLPKGFFEREEGETEEYLI